MPSEQMATAQTVVRDIDVRSADGLNLRGRWWRRPSPRAVAIVSHGFAEHGGCYRRVAEALGPGLDIDIVAVDYRGHGRSPGRRGVVRRYEDLIDDLSSAIAWTTRQLPSIPRYVIGHSNGGQVALRWALRRDDAVEGMVISNPAVRIAVPIPPAKLKLGRLLARFAPVADLDRRSTNRRAHARSRRFKPSIAPTSCGTIGSARPCFLGWSRGAKRCSPTLRKSPYPCSCCSAARTPSLTRP